MIFPYYQTTVINAELEVEDVGNCAIKAYNDLGIEHILVIDTSLGWSRIFQMYPIRPDFDLLLAKTAMTYDKIPYDDRKLRRIISSFLNSNEITQAFVVYREEALNDCKDMLAFMRQDKF